MKIENNKVVSVTYMLESNPEGQEKKHVETADASRPLGPRLGPGQRREQQGRENGDDGNYHQQFDQGETTPRQWKSLRDVHLLNW